MKTPLLNLSVSISALLVAITAPAAHADSIGSTPPGTQVLWLAADYGISTDSSNNLTSWLDASGNGHDWLGGTGQNVGNDATLVTGQNTQPSTNAPNSVPFVNFAAIAGGGLVLDHTGNLLDLTSFSVYIVANTLYRSKVTNVYQDFLTAYDTGDGAGYAVGTVDGDSTSAKFYTGTAGTNINGTNSSFQNAQFNFIAATIDPSQNKILTTGAYGTNLRSFTANGISFSNTQYVMGNLAGGSQPLFGDIVEMLVYNNAGLTAAQVQSQETAIQTYLVGKYFTAH